jgi:hypothetical protein
MGKTQQSPATEATIIERARAKLQDTNPHLAELLRKGTKIPAFLLVDVQQEKNTGFPLLDLLERINRADRGLIWNVVLNPDLGFNSTRFFSTANLLHKYLAAAPGSIDARERDSLCLPGFDRAIGLEELLRHSGRYPGVIRMNEGDAIIRRFGQRLEIQYREAAQLLKIPPGWVDDPQK